MSVLLVAIGVALFVSPHWLRAVGRRSSQATWLHACSRSMLVGAAFVEAGLVATALPTVLRAAGIGAVADACARVVAPIEPGGAVAGWLAAVLALWIAVAGRRGLGHARAAQRSALVEASIGDHHHRGGVDIVTLPTGALFAYSVDGREPQIVVTEGLCRELGDDLALVIAHERAHLDFGHQRLLSWAQAAETALGPLARPVASELRLAIERAADDAAAGADQMSRRRLHQALCRVIGVARSPVAALSAVDVVSERLDALEHVPAAGSLPQRLFLHVPGLVFSVAAVVMLSDWSSHVAALIAAAGRCPIIRMS